MEGEQEKRPDERQGSAGARRAEAELSALAAAWLGPGLAAGGGQGQDLLSCPKQLYKGAFEMKTKDSRLVLLRSCY